MRKVVIPMKTGTSTKQAAPVTRSKRGNVTDTAKSSGSAKAVVTFERSGAPKIAGPVTCGTEVVINYDYHRLLDTHPECIRRTPNGEIGEIQMGVRFNGDNSRIRYFKFVSGYSSAPHYRVPIENTVKIPNDAKKVEVWFSAGGPLYNYAYDSNYSNNYQFEPKESPKDNSDEE
jgi:hypothetical protein